MYRLFDAQRAILKTILPQNSYHSPAGEGKVKWYKSLYFRNIYRIMNYSGGFLMVNINIKSSKLSCSIESNKLIFEISPTMFWIYQRIGSRAIDLLVSVALTRVSFCVCLIWDETIYYNYTAVSSATLILIDIFYSFRAPSGRVLSAAHTFSTVTSIHFNQNIFQKQMFNILIFCIFFFSLLLHFEYNLPWTTWFNTKNIDSSNENLRTLNRFLFIVQLIPNESNKCYLKVDTWPCLSHFSLFFQQIFTLFLKKVGLFPDILRFVLIDDLIFLSDRSAISMFGR